MLELFVRDAASVVVKAVADVAVNVIKENPGKTLVALTAFLLGYEKGRADTCSEFTNAKRI